MNYNCHHPLGMFTYMALQQDRGSGKAKGFEGRQPWDHFWLDTHILWGQLSLSSLFCKIKIISYLLHRLL